MNAASPLVNELNPASGAFPGGRSHATASESSAVSWGAIFAGAAGAAALSLILLVLGVGLGLSSVSPWTGQGVGATTFSASTIAWLTFTQLAASSMGGYLAGRLRTKWISVHTDEVYFRDTAHGFLAWCVATLATAALLTSTVSAIIGGGLQAGAAAVGGTAAAAVGPMAARTGDASTGASSADGMGMGYFVDSLYRKDAAATAPADAPDAAGSPNANGASSTTGATGTSSTTSANSTAEVTRIFANDLRSGNLPAEDSKYVGQLVAQRTGMPQAEAEKRVTETFSKVQAKLKDAETAARDAADKTRKASAYAALWLFVSLLIGAFVASFSATYGGRRRDL